MNAWKSTLLMSALALFVGTSAPALAHDEVETSPLAKIVVPEAKEGQARLSSEEQIIKLFNEEVKKPNSLLAKAFAEIKAEFESMHFDDEIAPIDVVYYESGASGGSFGATYLILIRQGYRSSTSVATAFEANIYGEVDEESETTYEITKRVNLELKPYPAQVEQKK